MYIHTNHITKKVIMTLEEYRKEKVYPIII